MNSLRFAQSEACYGGAPHYLVKVIAPLLMIVALSWVVFRCSGTVGRLPAGFPPSRRGVVGAAPNYSDNCICTVRLPA
jgi:hypothetical protein